MARILAAMALAVALLTVAATAEASNPVTAASWVNQVRAGHGVQPLTVHAFGQWQADAQSHASRLASARACYHDSFDNIRRSAPNPSGWRAENVACWSSWSWTEVTSAFLASPSHLSNLVNPNFRHLTIGFAQSSTGGNYLVIRFGS